MFSHEETVESTEGRVRIRDFSVKAVKVFLYFMYTGRLKLEGYQTAADVSVTKNLKNLSLTDQKGTIQEF